VGKNNFSSNQLQKGDDRKCKDCTLKQQSQSKQQQPAAAKKGGGKSAPPPAKNGGGEKVFECNECGDELPAEEFTRNQLSKGKERKCKECVDFLAGGGYDDDSEEFDAEAMLSNVSPKVQKLIEDMMVMEREESMEMLQSMMMRGQLSEEELYQTMMLLQQLDGGDFDDYEEEEEEEDDFDEDEDEDFEGLSDEEGELIESLGLEVNVCVLHNFEKEQKLLDSVSRETKRSERVKIIHRTFDLKVERLEKLNRMYERGFSKTHEEVDDSEEEEYEQRVAKEKKVLEVMGAGEALDAQILAQAKEIYGAEDGAPLNSDLGIHSNPEKPEVFALLILWARGCRFDGRRREDPAIVKSAAAGDVKMVRALLLAGESIESCACWSHKVKPFFFVTKFFNSFFTFYFRIFATIGILLWWLPREMDIANWWNCWSKLVPT
jgi:hypothetical protein